MGYLGTKPANSPLTSELIPDGLIGTSDLANSSVTTDKIVNAAVTPAKLSQPLTLDTAKTATGTSVEFTGIPSWVKRITVMFNGVSTNGTSIIQVQIGSGSVDTSSYSSQAYSMTSSGAVVAISPVTTGFVISGNSVAADTRTGQLILTLFSGNTWISASNMGALSAGAGGQSIGSGNKVLSGTLDRIRITTVNGTDTFDAGTINIMYEG